MGWSKFGKALGLAAVGVGAIAAAPFTGGGSIVGAATLAGSLAGAGTVAAAVGAGAAGAVIGANLPDGAEKAHAKGFREGKEQGKTETDIEMTKLQKKFETALNKIEGSSSHFNAIIAMVGVAISVANCDGEICESEKQEIDEFIMGLSAVSLPEDVMEKINQLYQKPLNIKEAFKIAKESGVEISVFDDIIKAVMSSDNIIAESEKAYVQAWNELKSA
jgi:uncharacterized membrane protein YebE (DUF533 family)